MDSQRTILLVEDEGVIAMQEKQLLEGAGYRVVHCFTGEAAIEVFPTATPQVDLVLMDINLGPGMDGTETGQRILASRDVPLIFLSSHSAADVVSRTEEITSYGYIVKNTAPAVLLASIRMAFRLFQAHRRFRTIVENGPDGIYVSVNRRFVLVNDAAARLLGAGSPDELTGTPVRDRIHPNSAATAQRYSSQLYEGRTAVRTAVDVQWVRLDGSTVWAATTGEPIDYDGEPGVMIFLRPREIHHASLMFRTVLESSEDHIFIKDRQSRIMVCNTPFASEVGKSPDDLAGKTDQENGWPTELIAAYHQEDLRALSGESVRATNDTRQPDGSGRVFETLKTPLIDRDGQIIGLLGVSREVTDLTRAVEQNHLLLRELQHRVKNNLNIVISLLDLALPQLEDPTAQQVFLEARTRVHSMATIYDELHRTTAGSTLDLGHYLERLARTTFETYQVDQEGIELSVHCENVEATAATAVPVGLILNELMSNTLKYAFRGRDSGIVSVRFSRDGLTVTDNGVGLPQDFDMETSGGTGLLLVRALLSQLRGDLAIATPAGGGTEYHLRFSVV